MYVYSAYSTVHAVQQVLHEPPGRTANFLPKRPFYKHLPPIAPTLFTVYLVYSRQRTYSGQCPLDSVYSGHCTTLLNSNNASLLLTVHYVICERLILGKRCQELKVCAYSGYKDKGPDNFFEKVVFSVLLLPEHLDILGFTTIKYVFPSVP
jgi:hypothetical protein